MREETILVIEDNPVNLEIATFLLKEMGFSILSAENAEQGIQIAEQVYPDLILMDLHLPGMDGFEATRLLKSNLQLCHIPIVAFTALCMEDDQKKALLNGCNGIIYKPIDVAIFVSTIEGYIHPR